VDYKAVIAVSYLNRDLKALLATLTWNAFLPDSTTGLTFEVFLAGLCEEHPEEMSRQFQNPERIEELIRKYKPHPLKHIRPEELNDLVRERAAAAGVELPTDRPETVPALSVKMEPLLLAIFAKQCDWLKRRMLTEPAFQSL
jgi:hypothetical protein